MKHCEDFEELLALHVEGDLPPAAAREVERHVELCTDCRDLRAALIEIQSLFREVRGERVADDAIRRVRRRVMDRIAENPDAILGWRLRIERAVLAGVRRPIAVAAACGLMLLVVVALFSFPSFGPEDAPPVIAETTVPRETPSDIPSVATAEPAREPEAVEHEVVEPEVVEPIVSHLAIPEPEIPPVMDRAAAIDWNPDPVEIDIPPQRTVKLVTDNPKVIIYWVLDELGEDNEGGGA